MTEKEKFCKNIKKYESPMYALAYSIVRNEDDAADVISESICRAYGSLSLLKNEGAFKTWILRIVHNTAIEMIRKNSKFVELDTLYDVAEKSDGVDIATKMTLHDAVESLNEPYRTVVNLFYYENLSVSIIAQITGTSPVAVRQQLSRARKMLKKLLNEDF